MGPEIVNLKFILNILLFVGLYSGICTSSPTDQEVSGTTKTAISKLEMHLSAFGVESDDFPSIDVYVDFLNDSSNCHKWYYDPKHKDSTYHLTPGEIKKILSLLETTDLGKIKTDYTSQMSDQPASTTTIFAGQQQFVIRDYGLQAGDPFKTLYQLVYKF